ncbi:MAG: hypothetical protein HYT15_01105 [Candidatus Magasanikbacteria bacterium]|nr:hypothetical protein [Candidatus Magasanikbacteria bacterium]
MAKYNDLTMGQVEALVNKIGGMRKVQAILRGDLELNVEVAAQEHRQDLPSDFLAHKHGAYRVLRDVEPTKFEPGKPLYYHPDMGLVDAVFLLENQHRMAAQYSGLSELEFHGTLLQSAWAYWEISHAYLRRVTIPDVAQRGLTEWGLIFKALPNKHLAK